MKRVLVGLFLLVALHVWGVEYSNRWFFAMHEVGREEELEALTRLVEEAASAGYNGVVLSGLSLAYRWPEEKKMRLRELKRACDAHGVDLVPCVWSPGYGSMLGADYNLMAGLPVKEVPMEAHDGVAVFRGKDIARVENGGFEVAARKVNHSPPGWRFVDRPGEVAFRDTEVRHGGEASLRMENFARDPHGHGRACLSFPVQPHRAYRVRAWVRTDGLEPAGNWWTILFCEGDDERGLRMPHGVKSTQEWSPIQFEFVSGETHECRLYLGMWEGKAGRFWLDDVEIEELGVYAPLRRPGTPFVVRDAATGEVYVEGRDYHMPQGMTQWHAPESGTGSELRLHPDGRIREGTKLSVDYYTPAELPKSQRSTCMSEPAYYALCRESAKFLECELHPRKWFLDVDEIRAGGTCLACTSRGLNMGQILADCVTQLSALVREVHPDAELYMWSDMVDPKHNAVDHYYLCGSSYRGVWNLLPKEITIVCWHGGIREESLAFFDALGFHTLAAAYYDAETLDGSIQWLQACDKTSNCSGLMYTTWENRYELMIPFAKRIFGK